MPGEDHTEATPPVLRDLDGRVAHALAVERFLTRVGYAVVVLGLIGFAIIGWEWSTGDLDTDQAVAAVLGTALATTLSGATAYSAGVNLGLGAARLQLARVDVGEPDRPMGTDGGLDDLDDQG